MLVFLNSKSFKLFEVFVEIINLEIRTNYFLFIIYVSGIPLTVQSPTKYIMCNWLKFIVEST